MLPTRLALYIFSLLDMQSLLAARLICKRWEHHSAQRDRCELPENCTDVQLKMLLTLFSNVKSIVLPSVWAITKKGWLPLLDFEKDEDYSRALRWPVQKPSSSLAFLACSSCSSCSSSTTYSYSTTTPLALSITIDARKNHDPLILCWLAARLHRIQARNAAISVCTRGLELNIEKQNDFLRRRATLYQQMKLWPQALADLDSLLASMEKEENGDVVQILRQKSYVLQKLDRSDEALTVVNRTIGILYERRAEEVTVGTDVRFDRATILCRLKQYEAALQDLERCINATPVNVDIFAKCYQLRADVKAFLVSKTNHHTSQSPPSPPHCFDTPSTSSTTSPSSSPSPTPSPLSSLTNLSAISSSAHLLYGSPSSSSSGSPSSPYHLSQLQQHKSKEEALHRASRFRKRARINYTLRRYEEAIEDCKAAIQHAPCSGDFKLWSVWTGSLLHLRSFCEALEMSAKALECAQLGTSDWCLAVADRVDVLLGLDRAQEALDLTDRVLEMQPVVKDHWLVLSARARAQVSMGRHSEALSEINAILLPYPEDVHALRRRIVVLYDLGKLEDALNETLSLLELLNKEELRVSRFRREETRNWANSMKKCLRQKTTKERRRLAAASPPQTTPTSNTNTTTNAAATGVTPTPQPTPATIII
jgi:tetratricopeptide (TPR) repeat protein